MSEFGYQSFPDMHTIRTFADQEQLELNTPVMVHHQRCSADGNQRIMNRLVERWGTPASFEDFVHLSQLQQAEAVRMGVEHWRRNRNGNHCMGTVYWQLNDCWPVISWSSLDYYGRWKALHYAARRFFAPHLISTYCANNRVYVYAVNDAAEPYEIFLRIILCTYSGEVVTEKTMPICVPALSALGMYETAVSELIGTADPADLYLVATGDSGGAESRSILHISPLSHARLVDPELKVTIDGTYATISVRRFAKSVLLLCEDPQVQFSDNYFDLLPGEQKTVELLALNPEDPVPEIVAEQVTVKSFREMIADY
jgi:beta-mannosidase